MRHIYRYYNALEIRFPAIKEDVNIIDFAVMEAIRIFDYKAFEWIYKNKESLIQQLEVLLPIGVNNEVKQSLLDFIQKNEELVAKQNTKYLINFIFKSIHLSEILLNFDDKDIDQEKLEKEKRIAHKDFFEHYFSFKISSNNVSQIVINNFLKSDDRKRTEILSNYKKSKLSVFLKRVFYSFKEIKIIEEITTFIFNYSDKEELYLTQTDFHNFDGLHIVISFLNDVGNKFGFDFYLNEILSENRSYSRFFLQGFLRNRVNGSSNIEIVKFFPEELIDKNKERIILIWLSNNVILSGRIFD